MPCSGLYVHQVHARAIAVIDGGNFARDQGGHEGRHEHDVCGVGVSVGLCFVEFAYLWPCEALKGGRSRGAGCGLKAAEGVANFIAFSAGGGVHPDGRCVAGEYSAEVFYEGF